MEGWHIDKKGGLISRCRRDQLGSRSVQTGMGSDKVTIERKDFLDTWIVIVTRDFVVLDVALGACPFIRQVIEGLGGYKAAGYHA